jgi:hypothetical protein
MKPDCYDKLAEKFYLEPLKIGDTHTNRLVRLLKRVAKEAQAEGFGAGFDKGREHGLHVGEVKGRLER